MKKNRLYYYLPLAVAVVASSNAFGRSDTNSYDSSDFREDFQQGIVLTATSNAPAGATGKAQLIAANNNGTNSAVLFVKTTGLTNGIYSVKLTDVGGSNTYSLGSLNVTTSTNRFDSESENGHESGRERDNGGESGGEHNSGNWTNWLNLCAATNSALTNLLCGEESTNRFGTNVFQWYTNTLSAGSGSFVLPSGLAQSNVARIFISDSNGVVDLTGDFTGVTNSTWDYIETVSLVPGTAANVRGQATLTLTSKNGKTFGAFKLSATGLRANQKLYLTANGTNSFKVYTTKSGTLTVNSLPRIKIVNLKTVVATDVSSHVVFSVSF